MSGSPNESDIHLINQTDQIIAIECKYKDIVTNDDVKKSLRDIGFLKNKYGNKFKGYVFYSLKNYNIPKKGTSFEIVNNIPVIWHGTHIEQDPHFESQIVMMVKIAQGLSATMATGQHETDKIVQLLNTMTTELEKNKSNITSLHNNANTSMNIIKNMIDTNNGLITCVAQYMKDFNVQTIVGEVAHAVDCPHCSRVFKRPGDLKKHISRCPDRI
jgi:hypothetical protein